MIKKKLSVFLKPILLTAKQTRLVVRNKINVLLYNPMTTV
jgi:hypothetical protein